MRKVELIRKLQEQLKDKEEFLEEKIIELSHEYDTQKYINEVLVIARKSIDDFAEYISLLNDQEKETFVNLLRNMTIKEDEIKNAQKMLIKRCIYAVAVFFVVLIVTFVFGLVADNSAGGADGATSWTQCWNHKK